MDSFLETADACISTCSMSSYDLAQKPDATACVIMTFGTSRCGVIAARYDRHCTIDTSATTEPNTS